MSFLNQLKSQADALQNQRSQQDIQLEERLEATEAACKLVLSYLQDLAKQLTVIEPPGPALSLDGKTPWPPMKLRDFRVDARRKMLRDREVFDHIGMGWQIVPQAGKAITGSVSVNFLPDLERVESRLALGAIQHERKEIRHPQKNVLQAVIFEYVPQTRGNVTVTADHEKAQLLFRVVNTAGLEVLTSPWPATRVTTATMDDLAKRIVGQPNNFV